MARKEMILALTMVLAASPLSAAGEGPTREGLAPPGTAETKYCMQIEAITGSRLEEVKCWTREEWAQREVDVDKEWAREGVRIIG